MKKIFYYFLLIFIMLSLITILIMINKINKPVKIDETEEKLKVLDNIDEKINYFKYSNLDRYISFKEYNEKLNNIDIVTRVNLNLDKPFYTNTKETTHLNKINILVNKYNYLPNYYIPNNLVNINDKYSKGGIKLVYEAKLAFEKMCEDIEKENMHIRAISAYRSYEYQKNLYDNYVKEDGEFLADTYSARPGYSEHQTGLVVDIDNKKEIYENFENTNEFIWMNDNSYKYGFILRYPKNKEDITGYSYESWHYRYVGVDIAKVIHEENITFDEYYVRYIEK